MEAALEKGPLTVELLKEAKRMEFPDNVIARLTGKTEEEIKKIFSILTTFSTSSGVSGSK